MKQFTRKQLFPFAAGLAILAASLTLPAPNSHAQPPPPTTDQDARFESISPTEGPSLSSARINAIFQDRQGFMWFATGGGLARYDGFRFTIYQHDPGDPTTLSHDSVNAICEGQDGGLWVGTAGGLDRLDRVEGTFDHFLDGIEVLAAREDEAGTLWVGTWGGLLGFDRVAETISVSYHHEPRAPDDPATLSGNGVHAIHEDRQGQLWVGTNGGLDRFDRASGTFAHYRDVPGDVRAIYEDPQGWLWVGTDGGGIFKLVPGIGGEPVESVHYRHDAEDEHSLSDDRVTSILKDGSGSLWVGTADGLNQLVPSTSSGQAGQERFVHHRRDPADPHSLDDDAITALFEDRSGVLWIGTAASGPKKYNRRANQFTHYRERAELATGASVPYRLSDGRVLAIHEDRAGVLWVGTFDGGLNRMERQTGAVTVYRHDPDDPASLSSDEVRAVYEDSGGVLWVGTGDGWLERFDPQAETFVHHHYLGGNPVQRVVEDPAGNLWIGTETAGVYRLDRDRETLVQYRHDPDDDASLGDNDARAILADPAGGLWVGTFAGGISLWGEAGDGFTHYRHDPADPRSLARDAVLAFYRDPSDEGVLWIGTWGGGLGRFDRASGTFTHYTQADGLGDDTVGCILADSAGRLWLGTGAGLSRFDPRAGTFRNYDERDGVQIGASTPGACFRGRDGEMYFGGSGGLAAFQPDEIEDNAHAPPVAITAFKVFNRVVRENLPADTHINLSYEGNFVSFEFVALDYAIPEKNQYAYRMEGFDEGWIYAGTRRYADYVNLEAGDYVFRVKGANNDGVWNEDGISITITVTPPFWATEWFRATVLLLLLGSLLGGYWLRVRSIEARSRELERQVESRTDELSRANVLLEQEMVERARAEAALAQQATEAAVVGERNRLARDLHDSVTQSLYGVTLYAEAAARLLSSGQADVVAGHLGEVRVAAREALGEMRLLIFELRPPVLEQEGLAAALEARLEAVEGRARLKTSFDVALEGRLPDEVEEGLYRIAQEALNNVLKHAQARSVRVSLRQERQTVVLEVGDDGVGFDPSAIRERGGLGMRGMEERAVQLGARLTVQSAPGTGTKVQVEVDVGDESSE